MSGTGRPFAVARPGTTLHGERWPGRGPTVVLLHAGVGDRRSWASLVPLLRGAGTVVTYDRSGFGDSPPSTVASSPLDDLFAVLDELAVLDEHGGGPVWLVGSSAGGGLAVDAALRAPHRVDGLVLFAPAVGGAPEPELLDADTRRLVDELRAARRAGDVEAVDRLEVRLWLDGPGAPAGRVGGPARELALAMNAVVLGHGTDEDAGSDDAWSRWEELAVPTTVACGDLDVPHLLAQSHQLAARRPAAQLVVLPSVAHLPYLEDPGAAAAVVTGALRQRPRS